MCTTRETELVTRRHRHRSIEGRPEDPLEILTGSDSILGRIGGVSLEGYINTSKRG